MSKASVAGVLAAMVMAGCSNSVTTGTGGGGSGGSAVTTGGGGSTETSGGGGGPACGGYEDETGTAAVTFHIRNDAPQTLYLNADCASGPQYDLQQVGAGEDATAWTSHGGGCLQTCTDLQTEGPIACDPCAPSLFRLDPGQTIDVTWNGTGVRPGYMMPAACYAYPGPTSCSRVVAAPAGMWGVTAIAFSECAGPNCMCQPNGTCWGTPGGFQVGADTTTFSYPSETSVDVIFNACALGCPNQ